MATKTPTPRRKSLKKSVKETVVPEKDKWIQKAVKPEMKGALREQLGVPKGKTIPVKTLEKAARKEGKLGQRARLAQILKKIGPKKKGK